MWTPGIAALVMLLVVTRDGFSREGWESLGLHRLGLSVWWIAFLAALLIGVIATAIVWATTLAAFTATSSPIVVYYYLAGDAGILIVVGLAVVGILLAYRFRSRPDTPQDDAAL
jgi:hypothetical protein